MSETAELVRVEAPSAIATLSVDQVMHRLATIHELMAKAMTKDVDYGAIPGTNSKPTLLKPGAEKLCVLFQLDAQYQTTRTFDGNHLTVETYCTIYNSNTGSRLGGASAICSTREAKYAWRKAERKCPNCGASAIVWSKKNDCFMCLGNEKGGCWGRFKKGDQAIEGQEQGRVENPDLADCYNTVLRIAEKRAHVAAVRQVTGASAIFDEEAPHVEADPEKPQEHAQQAQRPSEPRAKIAESMCRTVNAASDEASIDTALLMAPGGGNWFKVQDEHTRRVKDVTREKRLGLRLARIGELTAQLGYDDVRLGLLASGAGVKDVDNLSVEDALELIKTLEAELERSESLA